MSQYFDSILENTNISDYNSLPNIALQTDKIGDIYDHINIFIQSLSSINLSENIDISTKENAEISLKVINNLKLEINERCKVLKGLKKVLKNN